MPKVSQAAKHPLYDVAWALHHKNITTRDNSSSDLNHTTSNNNNTAFQSQASLAL
jgi:hypothetical protein